MNESLSFRTILTEVTFVTASVAYLMLDPTCLVFEMPFDTFILAHVLVKCHFRAFVALSRSSGIFCRNRTVRFLHTCFDSSFLRPSAIFWYFSLQPKYLL
jgi:hypothetical protein